MRVIMGQQQSYEDRFIFGKMQGLARRVRALEPGLRRRHAGHRDGSSAARLGNASTNVRRSAKSQGALDDDHTRPVLRGARSRNRSAQDAEHIHYRQADDLADFKVTEQHHEHPETQISLDYAEYSLNHIRDPV